jgi:hypothetical protein
MLFAADPRRRLRTLTLFALSLAAVVASVACGDGDDDGDVASVTPGFTPPATAEPIPTYDLSTSTPSATDFVGVIRIDTNVVTPDVERGEVSAAVGATFDLAVVISDPPGPYRGYQVGIGYEDRGILSFVGEQALQPENMTVCSPVQLLSAGTLAEGRTGVYGGCLIPDGATTYAGPVTTLTFRCERAGRIELRLLGLQESQSLGTSLINEAGATLAEQVENGFDVVCG